MISQTHPHLLKELDTTNHEIDEIRNISSGSNKKFQWICQQNHTWTAPIKSRAKHNTQCPYCTGKKLQKGWNDLETSHFHIAEEWHPTKNQGITPDTIKASSTQRFWWLCPAQHTWEATVINRTRHNKQCPTCNPRKKHIITTPTARTTLPNHLIAFWDSEKNPQDITKDNLYQREKYYWICQQNHTWTAQLKTLINKKTTPCPYCNGTRITPGTNDAATLYPNLTEEWHPTKNTVKFNNLHPHSKKRVWWQCSQGHEWETHLYTRTTKTPSQCPQCNPSKGTSALEQELKNFLQNELGLNITPNDRTVLENKELDIYIPEHNTAIEFNGLYWHSEEKGKTRYYHYNKWKEADQKKINLIQVWEDDWIYHKNTIKNMLKTKFNTQSRQTTTSIIQEITKTEASITFNNSHPNAFTIGHHYLALKVENIIVAVMTLTKTEAKTFQITGYVSQMNDSAHFTEFINYTLNNYPANSLIIVDDHTNSNKKLYLANGFTAIQELPPDYMYIINKRRYDKNQHKTQITTNYLKIWDAGKTKYLKTSSSTTQKGNNKE